MQTPTFHRALAPVDLIIIGVYFIVIFAIGSYFARRERTSADYFLASRNVGWFAIGASLFVSNISTEHFIGLAGSGATSGLAVGHFEWLACIIVLILGWVFVPFYLRSNVFAGENAAIRVLDALRRQPEGAKVRQMVLSWLTRVNAERRVPRRL